MSNNPEARVTSCLAEVLAQFALQHFAGAVFWQTVDDPPMLRPLEAGNAIEAKAFEANEIERGAGSGNQHGHDAFAPLGIGNADHRGFCDVRILEQDVLDLARIDVRAARDDEIFGAVEEA